MMKPIETRIRRPREPNMIEIVVVTLGCAAITAFCALTAFGTLRCSAELASPIERGEVSSFEYVETASSASEARFEDGEALPSGRFSYRNADTGKRESVPLSASKFERTDGDERIVTTKTYLHGEVEWTARWLWVEKSGTREVRDAKTSAVVHEIFTKE